MSQWIAADVRAAGRGVGVADREVDRAVDLLVEADVLREALDARVAADPELAEPARALVGVERLEQEVLAGRGAIASTIRPCSKTKPDARDLVAEVDRRELAEGDLALGRVLDRRVEDLAARHVDVAVVDRPAAAGERERQVGPLADDPHLVGRVEDRGDPGHPPRLGVPVEQHGAEDELLVLRERHPRLLGRGVRRVLADHPRHLHRHLPAAERLDPLLQELAALVRRGRSPRGRSRAPRSR